MRWKHFKSYFKIKIPNNSIEINKKYNQTEVTSVKFVFFKYVMSFETLTKVDWLKEIVRIG